MRRSQTAVLVLFLLPLAWPSRAQENNLFKLVLQDDRAQLRQLLEADPLRVNEADRSGRTPLTFAVQARNAELARWLIGRGALVRVGDDNLRSPIHFAGWSDDPAMVDLLLESGAVVDTRAIGAATPLIHSSLGDRFEMCRHLIARGADINAQCNSLTTPLYFAALNGNLAYARFLLEAGADVDVPDFVGRTPLHVAVRDGNLDMAELLADAGADPLRRDPFLDRTLLHLASAEGHDDLAEFLVRRGVDVRAKDGRGETALDLALRYGHPSTVELLRTKGTWEGRLPGSGPGSRGDRPAAADGPGRAKVIRLQNGSWAVDTGRELLLFGYSEIGAPPDEKSLGNGYVTPREVAPGKPIYCVDHGFHPEKSAAALNASCPLYAMAKGGADVVFILNEANRARYAPYALDSAHFPELGKTQEIRGVRVTVLPSYGSHRCYVLELEKLVVVWLTGVCDGYLPHRRDAGVIVEVAQRGVRPDVLLLGTPEGIGQEIGNGVRESYFESQRLRPSACFGLGKEPEMRRVLEQIRRRGGKGADFRTADGPGDAFPVGPGAP